MLRSSQGSAGQHSRGNAPDDHSRVAYAIARSGHEFGQINGEVIGTGSWRSR
jgi:hypothetical protein